MNQRSAPICFTAGACTLCFSSENGRLESISGLGRTLTLQHPLWAVETGRGEPHDLIRPSDPDLAFHYHMRADDALDLHWEGPSLRVSVHCRTIEDMPSLTIDVALEDHTIHAVRFPLVGNIPLLSENGEQDRLVLPWQNGFLIDNPLKNLLPLPDGPFWAGRFGGKYENEYPAQYSFQFMAYYSDAIGLYFSTQDKDAHIKTIGLYLNDDAQSFQYRVTQMPEDMGNHRCYSSPYACVLTLFKGDWQTCTALYRRWALRQKWCPPAIAQRQLPEKLRKTDLWRINHGHYALGTRTEEYLETSRRLQQELGCSLALHWYGWNMGRHDVGYPDYMDPSLKDWPKELAAFNREFDRSGIVKIPYVNGRLWDENASCWTKEQASGAAIKDENGDMLNEVWNQITVLRPMCPATKKWMEKVVGFGEKYVLELGFDGLYVDQIASFNATLCFDGHHGHPIGGGSWWAESYCEMMRQLRSAVGADKILTSESCCEVYGKVFDIFLVLDQNHQNVPAFSGSQYGESLPLFNMIYGDHMLTYGSNCSMDNTLDQFEFNLIRNTLWGILPTIEGFTAADLCRDDAPAYLAVAREAVAFFQKNKDDFLTGRPAEILNVSCPAIRIDWTRLDGCTYTKTYPGVQAVRWELMGGIDALFAHNFLSAPVSVSLNGCQTRLAPHRLIRIDCNAETGQRDPI